MQRILIADASLPFSKSVSEQLGNDFLVQCCHDGRDTLRYIQTFDPEILLLDMMLPGIDGFSIIDSLRAAGKLTKVFPVLPVHDEVIAAMLSAYDISYMFSKPCSPNLVASFLRQYTAQLLFEDWSAETYLDEMLLRMGFSLWHPRYACIRTAILLRYRGEDTGVTKGVYPVVAKMRGSTTVSVEKAIRDMIRHAWKTGDRAIWDIYFPSGQKDKCPSNDTFISRMAFALRTKEQVRKPLEQKIGQIKIG